MELTLRTDSALDSLRAIIDEVPEMVAGIGTILTTKQIDKVVAAGAAFGVAPGLNRRIVEYAQDKGLPFGPGIMTPSDIEQGLELGCKTLKFFPAESSGGAKAIKAFGAPIPEARFCPTGGITVDNAESYLSLPNVMCVGGSWLTPKAMVDAEDWDGIRELARQAAERFHH